jgi:hypothetical protein
MMEVRLPPSHVVVDVFLSERVVQMVLAAYHMRHPQQMVIYRHGQIHHRIDVVSRTDTRMRMVNYSQRNEIPYRGIRMFDIRFNDGYRLSFVITVR